MSEMGNSSVGTLSERVRSLRLSEASDVKASGWWWIPWGACLVLLCAAGFFALEAFSPIDDDMIKKLAEERGLSVGKPPAQSAALEKLGLPTSTSGNATEIVLEAKGYIVPFSLIQVSPKITGTVLKLNIKEGMAVEKNKELARLEDIEYRADLDRSKGAINAAKARLDELCKYRLDEVKQAKAELDDAIAQFDQMKAKYERTVELYKSKAVAPEDFEAAQSAHQSMEARKIRLKIAYNLLKDKGPRDERIAAAIAEIKQAEADYDKAKWRFDNTVVKAPIKGIILSKKTEEGNIVNPSAFSNGLSASLCEMADLHDLEVDLAIAERDISKVFQFQECRIRAEAFPRRIYTGYVSRIMPMADRSKSSVPVRVKIQFPAIDAKGQPLPMDEQGEYLRPEMGAIVTFLNHKATNHK
jgi:multidrug resistance efflux pump